MKKDIRLIAMDMDGTLLNPAGQVTEYSRRILRECEARGIKIVLASGRSFYNLREFYKDIGLKSPVLSVNGVRADDSPMGPLLFDSVLDEEITRTALGVLRREKVHFDLFTRDEIYSEYLNPLYDWHDKNEVILTDGMRQEIVVENPERTDREGAPHAYKLIIMSPDGAQLQRIADELRPLNIDITTSGGYNIEVAQPGVNKGSGLKKLAGHYGIKREQVMAFGDYLNDLEMLEWAGESFAMENAIPEIHAIARHKARSNAEDGVARAIEEWVLC